MDQAGLPDTEFLARLRATDQIFELNEDQRRALLDAGISPQVVAEMPRINQAEKNRVLARGDPSADRADRRRDARSLDQLEAGAVGVAEEDGVEAVDRDLGPHLEPARPRVRDAEPVELGAARARVLDEIGEPETAELVRLLRGLADRRGIEPLEQVDDQVGAARDREEVGAEAALAREAEPAAVDRARLGARQERREPEHLLVEARRAVEVAAVHVHVQQAQRARAAR